MLLPSRRATARSRLAALCVAAALAAPLAFTAPAAVAAREPEAPVEPLTAADVEEATAAENARVVYDDAPELSPAATASVTGVLQTIEVDGTGPYPATSGSSFVRFWLWNEAQQLWIWERDVTTFDGTGAFTASGLTPGDYRVEFVSFSSSLPMKEYWNNRAFFFVSDTLTIAPSTVVNLFTVTLEPDFPEFVRVAGDNRYATAVAISQRVIQGSDSAPVVYVVTGTGYADALSAGPAAAYNGGVLLLTAPTSLPAEVAAELDRLKPGRVVIVGGPSVISPAVEQAVRAAAGPTSNVERMYGVDRYATSRLIVDDAFDDGVPHLFIATGRNFPDALAAGPAASRLGGAVLLVDGAAGSVDVDSLALITTLGLPDLHLAGGTSVISAGVEDAFTDHLAGAATVTRYAGANRYDTALTMNAQVFGGWGADFAFLATGAGFADALAGGPLAAALDGPLYLSNPSCLRDEEYIDMLLLTVRQVWAFGGPAALSDNVLYGDNC